MIKKLQVGRKKQSSICCVGYEINWQKSCEKKCKTQFDILRPIQFINFASKDNCYQKQIYQLLSQKMLIKLLTPSKVKVKSTKATITVCYLNISVWKAGYFKNA